MGATPPACRETAGVDEAERKMKRTISTALKTPIMTAGRREIRPIPVPPPPGLGSDWLIRRN
uniref:hypothetical protein n=1 Tax=Actinomadura sp. CA-154981 TaxID=3240037 RepID=UPI003F4948C7